jgi:hypothetical protein
MNNYNCERCGFSTDRKGNFKKHLFRKNICKPKLKDINIENIRTKYGFINYSTKEQDLSTKQQKNKKIKQILYLCKYCEKKFKLQNSKKRHEKKFCKIKKEQTENSFQNILLQKENENLQNILLEKEKENKQNKLKEEKFEKQISEMRKQIESLLEKVGNNNNNNNITINNINNIQLNNYGNENLEHITSDKLKKLIENPYKSVAGLIKNIHFSKECPENKNVRITNKKLPFAEVFKDNKWELCNKTEVVNEMLKTKSKILDTEFTKIEETLLGKNKTKYNTFKKNRDFDLHSRKNALKSAEIAILNGTKKNDNYNYNNELEIIEENYICAENLNQ